MKNNFKLLAMILAILMMISVFPIAAFAEEIDGGEAIDGTETEESSTNSSFESEFETSNDEPMFPLPEGDENVTYEQISKNYVKVTVFPNVTESPSNDTSLPDLSNIRLPGVASPYMIGGDMTDLGGGASGSATYVWTDITTRSIDEIFCDQCYNQIIAHLENHHTIGGN